MRLRRNSTQTTGARTSSDQGISPQVRKDSPLTNLPPAKVTKRTRRSVTTSTTSSIEQNDSSPKVINCHLDQAPGSLTTRRGQGARKSRQSLRINHKIATHAAILKDSSVTANSSHGDITTNPHSRPRDNHCTSGLAIRGKKKQISKDHSDEVDSQLFDVEDILDVKLENGRYYYLVKWEGYSDSDNTWEPEHHLPSDLLDFYLKKNQARAEEDTDGTATFHSDNCDSVDVNRENTNTSSHSRVTIDQRSGCKEQRTVQMTSHKTGQFRINCLSPDSASSSCESNSHGSSVNECISCFSFQANSPPESNGSLNNDLPHPGSSVDVLEEESSNSVHLNFDPLSLCNLKRVIVDKSSISSKFPEFQLNDSLVPGKIVCIDKSPFGTGKMALIKWIDHEPTTWLDYDFVKLKYPELLMNLYEELLVIDPTLPN